MFLLNQELFNRSTISQNQPSAIGWPSSTQFRGWFQVGSSYFSFARSGQALSDTFLVTRIDGCICCLIMIYELQDERLEIANNAHFQLIDKFQKQTVKKNSTTACYQDHFIEKIQGALYVWTAPNRDFMPFCYLLEYPQEEISTICFIPEQTHLQGDNYYHQLQLANRFYTGAKKQLDEAIKHYRLALVERTTIECLNNIGCALLQSKRLRDAKSHFLAAASLVPKAHEPYHNLAHTQIKIAISEGLAATELKNETMNSIKLYEKSLSLNPQNHFARHNIGNIHAVHEDYLLAIDSYLQALNLSPNYASSMCALAHCYRNIKQYAKAFETLLPLLKRNNSYSFLLTLANLLVQSSSVPNLNLKADCAASFSEFFKTKSYFKLTIRQRLQKVKPLYQQALKIKATSSSALTGLGNLKLLMGDYEQALQCYKKAIYFNSRCIAAHNGAALAFYCMRSYQLAAIKYQDSFKVSRNRLSTLLGTFVAKLKLKQSAQASHIVEDLSLLYPDNQLIYYYHSLLFKDKASRQEKIKEGLNKKRLFPSNGNLSFKIIGELMLQFGLLEEAVEYFRQMKDEYLLRRYHQQLIEPQKAVDAYIEALEQNRNDDQALYRIAEICFDYGLLEFCQAALVQLMKTDEQNIKFLCLLARVKNQQKKYSQEIKLWQQIVSLTDEAEDALNCLALAQLKQNNHYEASRYVRLALKKDPRNWAVLNNLANISRQIQKHQEARHYYRESQLAGPFCFVPFVNSAGLLPLYQAFPPTNSVIETFNLSLHFLFCDQYNTCFGSILKLGDKITDYDYLQIVKALDILQQLFSPFIQYGLLCKFLLSTLCNQSPLLELQRLLNLNAPLDGFANAMQSMNYPCEDETLNQILYLLIKQAFVTNQQEALIANDSLCRKYNGFQDYSKRKELMFWAQGQAAKRMQLLFKIIESLLENYGQLVTPSTIQELSLEKMYSGIKKTQKIRANIEDNEQIEGSQLEHDLSQALTIIHPKHIHYYKDLQQILAIISHEQATLVNELKKKNMKSRKKVFLDYYNNSYFPNLFIKYALNSYAHFIAPDQRIDLAKAFLEVKESNRGTIQALKIIIQEMSIKASLSNQSTASTLRISMEYEEKKKIARRSESLVNTKESKQKEKNHTVLPPKQARAYSKLIIVKGSNISQRSKFLTPEIPQSDHLALRNRIQYNIQYSPFNMCFQENRRLCEKYISQHSFEHLDSRETLIKTENRLNYQQMLELGHKEVFRFISDFSAAIIELEDHSIYHCDLSLRNVVRLEDTYKIIDFDFVLMIANKEQKFFQSTEKLINFWLQAKTTKQIQQTIIRYIFRSSDQTIHCFLFEFNNDERDPKEKIRFFLDLVKDLGIPYYRTVFNGIINDIVDDNEKTHKLFSDEIHIITEYLNRITKQPNAFKQNLLVFRQKAAIFQS